MIDTLFANIDVARNLAAWEEFGLTRSGYVLVTLHRPALVDDPTLILSTVAALEEVAREVPVLFPVHPRTRARLAAGGLSPERVQLVDPQSYRRFLSLQSGAAAVVTDSGGIQEETTALGIPCFTLRTNTERPATVTHGTNVVLGLDPSRLSEIPGLLSKPKRKVIPPKWDGHAGERAADAIEEMVLGSSARFTRSTNGLRPANRPRTIAASPVRS